MTALPLEPHTEAEEATLARLHHAQAGALASLAEQLEDAGHPEAAALADREAAIYTTWALLPEGPPPSEPLPREERARLLRERRAPIAAPVAQASGTEAGK